MWSHSNALYLEGPCLKEIIPYSAPRVGLCQTEISSNLWDKTGQFKIWDNKCTMSSLHDEKTLGRCEQESLCLFAACHTLNVPQRGWSDLEKCWLTGSPLDKNFILSLKSIGWMWYWRLSNTACFQGFSAVWGFGVLDEAPAVYRTTVGGILILSKLFTQACFPLTEGKLHQKRKVGVLSKATH